MVVMSTCREKSLVVIHVTQGRGGRERGCKDRSQENSLLEERRFYHIWDEWKWIIYRAMLTEEDTSRRLSGIWPGQHIGT